MQIKIEGPIPGGDLPPCNVLRCDEEGAYVMTVLDAGGIPTERLLCKPHKGVIDSGAPWSWDGHQKVLLLGTDRTADGRLNVIDYSVARPSDADSALGLLPVVVDLAGEGGQVFRFAISGEQALGLGELLKMFGHTAD